MNAGDPELEQTTGDSKVKQTVDEADLRQETVATVGSRKELGPEYEAELIESFLEKVEQRLDSVVEHRVRRQLAEQQLVIARGTTGPSRPPRQSSGLPEGVGARLGLAVVSLVLAIPLSAIVVANGIGMPGLLTCWGGVVAVNWVYAHRDHTGAEGRTPQRKNTVE